MGEAICNNRITIRNTDSNESMYHFSLMLRYMTHPETRVHYESGVLHGLCLWSGRNSYNVRASLAARRKSWRRSKRAS